MNTNKIEAVSRISAAPRRKNETTKITKDTNKRPNCSFLVFVVETLEFCRELKFREEDGKGVTEMVLAMGER